jgi:hypothetical protein
MYIVRISNKSGQGFSKSIKDKTLRSNNKRMIVDNELSDKVFEDNTLKRATDNLRSLKITKPRIPKKYISFE